MRSNPLALWLYGMLRPYVLYTLAAAGAAILAKLVPDLPILPLLPPLAAGALCLRAGRKQRALPPLSTWHRVAFFITPPAAFWAAFLLFFTVKGGIYVGLPALILAFALKPVVLLYALLAMVNSGLVAGLMWPAWSLGILLILLSVSAPLCFWLGWRSAGGGQTLEDEKTGD